MFQTNIVMHQENPSAAWSFFDRIYCISLEERTDRRAQASAQFARVGLASRVEYVVVERHPTDCEQGIYEAHIACVRMGLAADARNMIIFEDDVIFDRFSTARLKAGIAFLKQQPAWKILFWGCLVRSSRRTNAPAVRKVAYRCLAHAYALNRPCAELLAGKAWRKIPFDAMLGRFENDVYALYPSFAFQSDSPSDNVRHRRLESFRRRCGGLRRIQKVNEWYHRNRALLIALQIVGLGVLLWAIVCHPV